MAKKQSAVKEKQEKVKAQAEPEVEELIDTVYLIKKAGIEILEGVDAEADIKAIREGSKKDNEGDTPYTFYEEDGTPIYIAIKNGY